MREVGVRELKRTLSETLRTVSAGDHVRVTVHGRAVADIVPARPLADRDHLKELIATGRVAAPVRARPKRAPRLAKAHRSASELVLADRDAER